MTLKEKFKQWLDTNPICEIREYQLEKFSEDFAIGFGLYVLVNNGKFKYIDLEKMLKMYKKEKGL